MCIRDRVRSVEIMTPALVANRMLTAEEVSDEAKAQAKEYYACLLYTSPSKMTFPSSGAVMRLMMRISVVLPAPLGPSRP